jgi:hypothetical protein
MTTQEQLTRIALYAFFSAMASQGVGVFDAEAGTLTLSIDSLAVLAVGVVGFLGTFAWWAKRNAR